MESSRTHLRLISDLFQLTLLKKRIYLPRLFTYLVVTQVFPLKGLYSSFVWVLYNYLLAISTPSFDSFLIEQDTWTLSGFKDLVSYFHLADLLLVTDFRNVLQKLSVSISRIQFPATTLKTRFCFILSLWKRYVNQTDVGSTSCLIIYSWMTQYSG